jgi:hypothetical protein
MKIMNTRPLSAIPSKMVYILLMLTAMLTACVANNDNTAADEDAGVIYVQPEAEPTTDAMSVTVDGLTYVFDGGYQGDGKALVARVGNRAASLVLESDKPNEEVENIILHNGNIGKLTDAECAALIVVLAKGGSIAIAEPTLDQLQALVNRLRSVINGFMEGDNTVLAQHIVQMLNTETLNRIVMWTAEDFDFSVYLDENGRGDYLSLAIFRGNDTYLAYRASEELTDYQYGQKADRAAEWLNTKEDEASQQAARWEVARMMAHRAGGTAEQYVDKISDAQETGFEGSMKLDGPQGYSRNHRYEVNDKIWTAYSKEKKCDVYCVTSSLTVYNQDLNCGPSGEREWYDGRGWQPWENLNATLKKRGVYGPYMRQIYTRCELEDAGNRVKIENYAPMNSTSGGQNVTTGFTFQLGPNASVSASGPMAGASAGMSWSSTVSKFDADLAMTASPSPDGVAEWRYTGPSAQSYWALFRKEAHDIARHIQTNPCTVQQAWVWTVPNSSSKTVVFNHTFNLRDEWLTYDCSKIFATTPHHIQPAIKITSRSTLNCPPRFIQTWSMSVSVPENEKGADVTKIKNYLTDQLKQYFLASCVFYTRRPDHKKAYNEGKSVAQYDEIGQFVVTAKNAFTHNDNVKEILREAAQVGGMPKTGSYTIVWRQTDAGINSDKEEFVVNY